MNAAVEICNDALARVAEREIMSLDDSSREAALCRRHFANTVREVLRAGGWRCARKRAVLAKLADRPAFGWHGQFALPFDFLRTLSVNDAPCGSPGVPLFEIEGRAMMTNAPDVRLVYVRDITMEGAPGIADADPLLCKAIALALAAKLAWPFQQSRTLRESLLQEYDMALRDARGVNERDAFEHTTQAVDVASSPIFISRLI